MDNKDRLRSRIKELLVEHDDHADFEDSTSLVKAGRLDSMDVTKIVIFLENDFGVDFARIEFDPERLDSIDELSALIQEANEMQ